MEKISIEVAYATIETQITIPLTVPAHTTVEQAIEQSNLLQQFPEIDLSKNTVGIFSQKADLQDFVKNHDRVEIYRPLLLDPKQKRHQRVKNAH